MRVSTSLAAAAALAVSVSAAPNVNDANKNILKGAYIVQFVEGHVSKLPPTTTCAILPQNLWSIDTNILFWHKKYNWDVQELLCMLL